MSKKQYLKENGWYAFYNHDNWYYGDDYPSKYDKELKLIPPPKDKGITLEEAYIKAKQR